MPSEPIEAEFSLPPALSPEQEEAFRTLEIENLPSYLSSYSTEVSTSHVTAEDGKPTQFPHIKDLTEEFTKEGYKIVTFEKGRGDDPREWSVGKKWYLTGTTATLCLSVAIGSSIITGDMIGPTKTLHTQQEITDLTVTCFVMGFGIGPLFMAPLSEVFGRKPIYCASMFLYFIFTLPSALAQNAATLVIGRMLAGLCASAPMCNVGGSIADVWAIKERGAPMAVFSATIFLGPCLGPIIGAWIGMFAGWRWIYWVLFIFTGVCFCLTLFIPESLAPVLLRRKAEALRKSTGDDSYRTLEELEKEPFKEKIKVALTRPFLMLLQEPIVIFMSFYLSFVYGLLYLLFFAFPIAFGEIRGFSNGITGTTFVSIMLGIIFAMFLIPVQERFYAKATKHGSYPEARLYPMMCGAFILPAALFLFAFTGAYPWVHWIAVCIAGTLFGFAMILLYVSANSYIIDSYSNHAASAMAAKTLLRSEVGAMIPLFVNQMFHGMGFQFAGLLLALIATLIAPIPFIFYKYGEKDVAMDVDAPVQPASPTTLAPKTPLFPVAASNPLFPVQKPKPVWVAAPSRPEDLGSCWTEENSTEKRLVHFLARWPPSRTPTSYGPWILADRGGLTHSTPNLAGLAADFQSLLSGDNVKIETLDQIAKTNNVLGGKWMVFEESAKIDMLWGKILYDMCMERKKGQAKVSTYKEDEKHVICVYVDDYTDKEEVTALRKALRSVGVKWKIGFKPDAYTHLNIYKDNPWKIRPSRYLE